MNNKLIEPLNMRWEVKASNPGMSEYPGIAASHIGDGLSYKARLGSEVDRGKDIEHSLSHSMRDDIKRYPNRQS